MNTDQKKFYTKINLLIIIISRWLKLTTYL